MKADEELEGEWDEEKELIWRAKWTCDGAKDVDEMIKKLEGQIYYLKELKKDGWKLQGEVQDDYAFLRKRA